MNQIIETTWIVPADTSQDVYIKSTKIIYEEDDNE